jgi:probable HAF family extracellular repeat protein
MRSLSWKATALASLIGISGCGEGFPEQVEISDREQAMMAAVPRDYEVTDLGTFPEDFQSEPRAIDERGDVVGFSGRGTGSETHAFLWQPGVGGGLRRLPPPAAMAGARCIASDVNESLVAVGACFGGPLSDQFVYWKNFEGHAVQSPENSFACSGTSINDRQRATVNCRQLGRSGSAAFTWKEGEWTRLSTFEPTGSAAASSINQFGIVAGDSQRGSFVQAAAWIGRAIFELRVLPGELGGSALHVNDKNDVVGYSLPSLKPVAWIWKTPKELARLPGAPFAFANSINDRRVIVGYSGRPSNLPSHAVLWITPSDIVDLNSRIPPNSSVELISAVDINSRGQIVCQGLVEGDFHAILLTPMR